MKHKHSSRSLNWISSSNGHERTLAELNDRMNWFYGKVEGREIYQEMLNSQEELPTKDSVRHSMPQYICDIKPHSILEIGCGNGRVYRQLRTSGYKGNYSGVEVAEYIVRQNQQRHPEASWHCATGYNTGFEDNTFDVCFSLYVLEHFVYPEKALFEMMRVIKPGGELVLVFPDFVASGMLNSQQTGFSVGGVKQKLKHGHLIDAVVSLYDARVRLPKALSNAVSMHGPFPINAKPVCLSHPDIMGADVDAIYIASKEEVCNWAIANGYKPNLPHGIEGELNVQAFVSIAK